MDATILHAEVSTKNRARQRDPGDAFDAEGKSVVLRDEGMCMIPGNRGVVARTGDPGVGKGKPSPKGRPP